MEMFSKFNFVTYFVIICPATILLAFYVGEHVTYEHDQIITEKGFGPMGTWYAFIGGLCF